ncbi:MAG: hypothetical protein AAGC60_25995 [Acidobacteriota bacterium]
MSPKGRSILAVVAGMVTAFVTIMVVEFVGHTVYPPPPGIDISDPESLKTIIDSLPLGALVFVLVGWFIGTLDGSFLAALLAPSSPQRHALIVAALVLAAGVATMLMIPHPPWMWVAAFVIAAVAGFAGGQLGARIAVIRARQQESSPTL